jgi:hypothetical protein
MRTNSNLLDKNDDLSTKPRILVRWGSEPWWPWVYRPGKVNIGFHQGGKKTRILLKSDKRACYYVYLNPGETTVTIAPSRKGQWDNPSFKFLFKQNSRSLAARIMDIAQGSLNQGLDVYETIPVDKKETTLMINIGKSGRFYLERK